MTPNLEILDQNKENKQENFECQDEHQEHFEDQDEHQDLFLKIFKKRKTCKTPNLEIFKL